MSGCTITLTGNLWARVQGGPGVLRLVDDALTFRPKGFAFSPAFRNGFWDGTIHLLRRDRFPAGLVEHVCAALTAAGMRPQLEDTRRRPQPQGELFPEPLRLRLKKYQEEAVEAACKAGRGVIHHPVGAGKSIVLLETVRRLNIPTLVLVHRRDLLYQLGSTAQQILGLNGGKGLLPFPLLEAAKRIVEELALLDDGCGYTGTPLHRTFTEGQKSKGNLSLLPLGDEKGQHGFEEFSRSLARDKPTPTVALSGFTRLLAANSTDTEDFLKKLNGWLMNHLDDEIKLMLGRNVAWATRRGLAAPSDHNTPLTIDNPRSPGQELCVNHDIMIPAFQEFVNGPDLQAQQVGLIGDGHWEDGAPLTVATFQSLYSRLKGYDAVETRAWLKRFQAVHIDEGHHIEAATYEKVLSHLPEAYYRFAYSATPFRSGDKGTFLRVVGWTGPVIHKLTSEKGIKAGRLVPADIFIVTPTPGARPRDTDYQKAYDTGITKHTGRNKLTIRLAQATRRRGPTLILVERLEHGETLAAGLGVKFLSGSTPGYERNLAWQTMRDGGADCLVASVIADEGLDIPNIKWLILAGGGRAAHRQIQRIGRGLRRIEGKDRLRVFDFDDRGFYLGRHARARRRTYDKEPAYNVAEIAPEEIEEWLAP